MELIYTIVLIFIGLLALLGLYVGVSNDAVNFLNSAIGAKAAKFRTILIIASIGVLVGALMSNGMMEIARNGVMNPTYYTFREVMCIFLAVMVANIIIVDIFNTLGLPTSTTVTLVFGLLGGTAAMALIKKGGDPSLSISELMNAGKALSMIAAIFLSVAVAFFFGTIVQWLSRLAFTFRYHQKRLAMSLFGGIATTILAYFIFIEGITQSALIAQSVKDYIETNLLMFTAIVFGGSSLLMYFLCLLRIDVLRVVVLMGTFALAMAFAGNDLVNFIGVPLAGLSSYQDFIANGNGADTTFLMSSLKGPAQTPTFILLVTACIMVFAMATSKKAQNVVKTSVDLARQDEGDQMFGTSRAARSLVRLVQNMHESAENVIPTAVNKWIDTRFSGSNAALPQEAAFDMVRASVNLVLAALLIIVGTHWRLPLSTTYVTFMVAMGTSLADRAWGRETAVFRITGVLSVVGGWFITAAAASIVCALVCLFMSFGGFAAMMLSIVLVTIMLIRSNRNYKEKQLKEQEDSLFPLMMRSKDPELVWELLRQHVTQTQSETRGFILEKYNELLIGLQEESASKLRQCQNEVNERLILLKKQRKRELLALKRIPQEKAIRLNTWFHLGMDSNMQSIYSLQRLLEPVREHVDSNFNPLPEAYILEFGRISLEVNGLMNRTEHMITENRFENYREVMDQADLCKDELSRMRKLHINRMQVDTSTQGLQVALLYLNLLQETQQLLSHMRHQLRAAKKFLE